MRRPEPAPPPVTARRPGALALLLLRGIDRYRGSKRHAAVGTACRFRPTCSVYAEEALLTRSLPLALVLVAWRLARCNPLARAVAADPVRPLQPRRPRPNTVPTVFALGAMLGFFVVFLAGVAQATAVSGGCTATVNGRDPATMTASDPLVVHKGETVTLTGSVPPSVASPTTTSVTVVHISIVEGVAQVTSETHSAVGPTWSGSVGVDQYLKYGSGLYLVSADATGTPAFSCSGSGYVKLEDGNPLTKPIGAAATVVGVVGLAGAVASARAKPPTGGELTADLDAGGSPTAAEVSSNFVADANMIVDSEPAAAAPAPPPQPQVKRATGTAAAADVGCLAALAFAIAASHTLAMAAVGSKALVGAPTTRRVWRHGHVVWGVLSGLLAGLGIAVVAQQFAFWPLTVVTAIVFPVVVAVLCGLRAWLGTPYTVTLPPSTSTS